MTIYEKYIHPGAVVELDTKAPWFEVKLPSESGQTETWLASAHCREVIEAFTNAEIKDRRQHKEIPPHREASISDVLTFQSVQKRMSKTDYDYIFIDYGETRMTLRGKFLPALKEFFLSCQPEPDTPKRQQPRHSFGSEREP